MKRIIALVVMLAATVAFAENKPDPKASPDAGTPTPQKKVEQKTDSQPTPQK